MKNVTTRIEDWWKGKYIPPPDPAETYPLVFISPGRYERPLLAKAAIKIGTLFEQHGRELAFLFLSTILGVLLTKWLG